MNRFYTPEAVKAAIALAHERQYIKDPELLARQYAEMLRQRGKGPFYINQTLKKKGLPAIKPERERELEKCLELLGRRFTGLDFALPAVRVKAMRHLTARGFDSETVQKAIREFKSANPLVDEETL